MLLKRDSLSLVHGRFIDNEKNIMQQHFNVCDACIEKVEENSKNYLALSENTIRYSRRT